MIEAVIREYGLPWFFYRLIYAAKLKGLRMVPQLAIFFEKDVKIKKVDIFDYDIKAIASFLQQCTDKEKEEIIAAADKAIHGKLTAFSSIELDYKMPIKWNYNPLTEMEIDNSLNWYQIPDFDVKYGDIKVIWEASRFTYFFSFIRAYLITKQTKYYEAFSKQLESWVEDNKYGYGPNYKCGQEATLRMINALMTYNAFKQCGLDCQKDKMNLFRLVEGSYKKVLSNFFYAHKCIKNNHTLSELVGLIIGAWCSEDEGMLKKAYHLLEIEIKKQFLPDGGYIQYSLNYQRFALALMEVILKISSKTNSFLSSEIKELIKKSVIFMYQLQDSSGDVPNYGSNDGALLFPLSCCDYRDFRPTLNTLYTLLEGKRLYKSGIYDEELLWFGSKALLQLPEDDIMRKSTEFKLSGFYSLRRKNGFLMVILHEFQSRPGQMDQLHIDLWHRGRNVLCDSGTYSYADSLGSELSSTRAHNTVQIDNKEQMKKRGHFLIYDWSKVHRSDVCEDKFVGEMLSRNGYSHARTINLYSAGYTIEDTVRGEGKSCYFYFHTPYKVLISEQGIDILDDKQLLARIITTEKASIQKAYRSLYYMKREEITRITFEKTLVDGRCNSSFKIQLFDAETS